MPVFYSLKKVYAKLANSDPFKKNPLSLENSMTVMTLDAVHFDHMVGNAFNELFHQSIIKFKILIT